MFSEELTINIAEFAVAIENGQVEMPFAAEIEPTQMSELQQTISQILIGFLCSETKSQTKILVIGATSGMINEETISQIERSANKSL